MRASRAGRARHSGVRAERRIGIHLGDVVEEAEVDSDVRCNPVDSIGSSTESRVSHSQPRLLLSFQGTKTARREGKSSPFNDAGCCTSRQNSGDGDLMGDGVNIAAGLEGIAKPGTTYLSEDAYR